MIKLVTLLTRRPGMSKQDFIAYYESTHRLIGEKVLGGYASRYVRRFTTPADGVEKPGDPDVVMEIWFKDRATYEACFAALSEPEVMQMVVEDEERLFDRPLIRGFLVEEHESELPPVA